MKPYYVDDAVTIYHGDCREILPSLVADVLITDPPYGIALDTTNSKHIAANSYGAIEGDAEDFDPAHLLAFRRAVIFGANNFSSRLPDKGGWIVWDKVTRNGLDVRIAEAELAWTNCLTRTRVFRHMWSGAFRDSERGTALHPSQKPVALMRWIVDLLTKPGEVIVDPYLGSGPVLAAAKDLGRRAIGIEIDERYCETAARRCSQEVLGLSA